MDVERLRRRYERLEDMEEWRDKEYKRILDETMRKFSLNKGEQRFAIYLFRKIRKWGAKSVHPHLSYEELSALLCYFALRHFGRRAMIHKHKDLLFFDPNDKALVAISNILSLLIKERGLVGRF